jgi:hypothetical protein
MDSLLEFCQIDAIVQNDNICAGQAFCPGGLLRHDLRNRLATDATAGHDPLNLGLWLAVDHADFV